MNQICQLHYVYILSLVMEQVNIGVEDDEFSENIQTSTDIWVTDYEPYKTVFTIYLEPSVMKLCFYHKSYFNLVTKTNTLLF